MSTYGAGRELDALVAERVMGLTIYHSAWPCGYQPDGCELEAAQIAEEQDSDLYPERHPVYDSGERPLQPDEPFVWLELVPFYSSDIAAAWQVLDRMADMGYVVIVKADGLRDGTFSPRYTAFCGNQPRTDAVTGPLAICIAALKALGELK